MILNGYVVESENTGYWYRSKGDAEKWLEDIRKDGQKDIRFVYAKIEVMDDDPNTFEELEVLETYIP